MQTSSKPTGKNIHKPKVVKTSTAPFTIQYKNKRVKGKRKCTINNIPKYI